VCVCSESLLEVDFWLGDPAPEAHQPLQKRDFLKNATEGSVTLSSLSLGREVLHLSPSGEEPRWGGAYSESW